MTARVASVLTLSALALAFAQGACQQRSAKATPPPAVTTVTDTAKSPSGPDSSTSAPQGADAAPKDEDVKELHVAIAPGWGYQLGPLLRFDYKDYMAWLTEAGVPAERIHLLTYSYLSDMATIDGELDAQFRAILAKAGPDARIDLIGHSMGGFVGLYTAMRHDYAHKFRRFISLAGIPFGWDNPTCQAGICGKAHPSLTPFRSPFVLQFHKDFAERIAALKPCSLFSPADAFVKPYDAGKMPNGTNVEVPDMGHLAIIGERKFFDVMVDKCYGGKIR